MPGQLIHTNEILVLLGDNWFAERSAKQAGEIVERRIAGACCLLTCYVLHCTCFHRFAIFLYLFCLYFVQRYVIFLRCMLCVVLDKQMEELNKQIGLLKPRVDFTSEIQNMAQVGVKSPRFTTCVRFVTTSSDVCSLYSSDVYLIICDCAHSESR